MEREQSSQNQIDKEQFDAIVKETIRGKCKDRITECAPIIISAMLTGDIDKVIEEIGMTFVAGADAAFDAIHKFRLHYEAADAQREEATSNSAPTDN